MLKFGLKLFQDRKQREDRNSLEAKPEFGLEVTSEGGQNSSDRITATVTPPDDAILGTTGKRKPSPLRKGVARVKRSSTFSESGRIRLIHLIENEETRTRFRQYLVSQYCEENLDFYVDVTKYRSLFEITTDFQSTKQEAIDLAVYIWEVYLDEGISSKPLNVPQDLKNHCGEKMKEDKYTVDLFDKLQQHCFDLMVQDSLPKFTRNSLIVPTEQCPIPTSSGASPTFLAPSSLMGTAAKMPRKSISSGSLRSTLSSLTSSPSNSLEPNIRNSENSLVKHRKLSLQVVERPKSNSALFSAAASQRVSMVSASITNITRMLSRRHDSTCSISSQTSVSTTESSSTASSKKCTNSMPGSYPELECSTSPPSLPPRRRDRREYNTSTLSLQILRRNASTPNIHSDPKNFRVTAEISSQLSSSFSAVAFFNPAIYNKPLPPSPEHVTA